MLDDVILPRSSQRKIRKNDGIGIIMQIHLVARPMIYALIRLLISPINHSIAERKNERTNEDDILLSYCHQCRTSPHFVHLLMVVWPSPMMMMVRRSTCQTHTHTHSRQVQIAIKSANDLCTNRHLFGPGYNQNAMNDCVFMMHERKKEQNGHSDTNWNMNAKSTCRIRVQMFVMVHFDW